MDHRDDKVYFGAGWVQFGVNNRPDFNAKCKSRIKVRKVEKSKKIEEEEEKIKKRRDRKKKEQKRKRKKTKKQEKKKKEEETEKKDCFKDSGA